MSIVVSSHDRRAVVLRNGIEIGRARIDVRDPATPLGTHAYQMVDGTSGAQPSWVAVGGPRAAAKVTDPLAASRVTLPPPFVTQLRPLLTPGTTIVVTDDPIRPDTTGTSLEVVNADPPSPG